jgi:hypothetical protein
MGITPVPWTLSSERSANLALWSAAPEIAAALVAIVDAFREPHYGDREQQADSVFDAMEKTGALALVEKLKGIL